MIKTREKHRMWEELEKMPKELREKLQMLPTLIGKWHYHYENKNGRIGLIRLNNSFVWKKKSHCYEACGVLDFERFRTKELAEIAIYKALKEEYPKREKHVKKQNSNHI